LSGGLRQRILLAMALSAYAELVFLDEPTLGLDAANQAYQSCLELAASMGIKSISFPSISTGAYTTPSTMQVGLH